MVAAFGEAAMTDASQAATANKMSIYDAAIEYQAAKTPLIVIAGQEYGTG